VRHVHENGLFVEVDTHETVPVRRGR
jgi:hypothetical protein